MILRRAAESGAFAAEMARTVFVLKRGQGAGFSGLVNTLFFRPNCRMLYGDAKATMSALVSEFEG